jgi:hypothetical protein
MAPTVLARHLAPVGTATLATSLVLLTHKGETTEAERLTAAEIIQELTRRYPDEVLAAMDEWICDLDTDWPLGLAVVAALPSRAVAPPT